MRTPLHLVCLGVVLCAGCGDGDSGSTAPAPPSVSNDPELVLPTQLPTGWKIGPTSSQRSASYVIEGNGAVADVSLLAIPGRAGGLLLHVNSWRRQLGQPALDQLGFEQHASWRTTPVGEGLVVDLIGMAKGADPSFDGRTVAVVVEHPLRTWFFKLRGNAALVDAQKSAFLDWVDTVRLADPDRAPAPIPPDSAPLGSTKPPTTNQQPVWQVPERWDASPATPDHYARFSTRAPRGAVGEVAISLLDGNGGGALTHVNRWRQQAGLPPIAGEHLASCVQSIFSHGATLSMVQIAGPKCGTIAAWTTRPEGTWIITITGPASVIATNRSDFAAFLRSIRFPGN